MNNYDKFPQAEAPPLRIKLNVQLSQQQKKILQNDSIRPKEIRFLTQFEGDVFL